MGNVITQGYFGNVPHIIRLSAHFCGDGLIHPFPNPFTSA